MPASLRPCANTSLGHFNPASTPATAATASTTATPVANGSQPHASGGTSPPSTPTDIVSCAPGDDHTRPLRPRPAVCCAAISTAPALSAPAAARASKSALVDPVRSTMSSRRHCRSGPMSPSRSDRGSSGGGTSLSAIVGDYCKPPRDGRSALTARRSYFVCQNVNLTVQRSLTPETLLMILNCC